MQKKTQMVTYFFDALSDVSRSELNNLITEDFSYKSDLMEPMNFDQFVIYTKHLSDQMRLIPGKAEWQDDNYCVLDYIVEVLDNSLDFKIEIKAKAHVYLLGTLIDKIVLEQEIPEEHKERILEIRSKILPQNLLSIAYQSP